MNYFSVANIKSCFKYKNKKLTWNRRPLWHFNVYSEFIKWNDHEAGRPVPENIYITIKGRTKFYKRFVIEHLFETGELMVWSVKQKKFISGSSLRLFPDKPYE